MPASLDLLGGGSLRLVFFHKAKKYYTAQKQAVYRIACFCAVFFVCL